jgi:hypothetical protein
MKWLARQKKIRPVFAAIRGKGGEKKDRGELSHSTIRAPGRMCRSVGGLQSEGRSQSIVRRRRTPLRHPRSHHLRTACLVESSSAGLPSFDFYSISAVGGAALARLAS